MSRKVYIIAVGTLVAGVFCGLFQGCAATEDFVTLFNVYYNAKRIMNEVEEPPDETGPATGGMLQVPTGGAPSSSTPKKTEIPEYYEELIRKPNFDAAQKVMNKTIVQKPNAGSQDKLLDSVVLKCTKILKFHSNSSYVPDALYMIAKAYYYKGKQTDFLYSKQKCEEFIQTFPDNDLYVDAHLLLAEDLVALKDDEDAHRALSRCVDIALPRKRYDVVSTALELTADLAMKHGDLQGAIDPYLHAMLLSHNDEANAEWQLQVAALFLETKHFYDAIRAFKDVDKYDPDDFPAFEAKYGLGVSYREAHYFDSSAVVFNDLLNTSKYSDWKGYNEFELATLEWVKGNIDSSADEYKRIDTAYKNTELSTRANYEYAMRLMDIEDYSTARERFEKVQRTLVPYAKDAQEYYTVLSVGGEDSKDIIQLQNRLVALNKDSVKWTQPYIYNSAPDTAQKKDVQKNPATDSNRRQTPVIGGSLLPSTMPSHPAFEKPDTAHRIIAGKDTSVSQGAPQTASLSDSAAAAKRDSLAVVKRTQDSLRAVTDIKHQHDLRDTTANQLATKEYEVGRMYFLLGKTDSMFAYYQRALNTAISGDIIPKILYSYALYYQDNGLYPDKIDSLMQIIADKFPLSEYAELARLHLGLTAEAKIDSAETQYISGESYMRINDDSTAERRYWNVYTMFPNSDYAPEALYAIGWMFENKHSQYDSAKYYYDILIKQYPNSEYAKSLKHLFMAMADTGKPKAPAQSKPTVPGGLQQAHTPQEQMQIQQEMMRRRMMQHNGPGQIPGQPSSMDTSGAQQKMDTTDHPQSAADSTSHQSADTSSHQQPLNEQQPNRQQPNGQQPPNGMQPPNGLPGQRKHP
ncbi:MAG TPA: tetratricopeptide repeat protein [Candidatus Kapabacteria bacterium]|nr:tetratricopeptide repeat protein [Candidatus Kapabacteria bacterium]